MEMKIPPFACIGLIESGVSKMKSYHVFLVALLIFSVLTSSAQAKSYTLEKAETYYKIQPNGLVNAEERIEFSFSGDFSYAFRTIPDGPWSISNISVYDSDNGMSLNYELR